jgi:hypothetical protein
VACGVIKLSVCLTVVSCTCVGGVCDAYLSFVHALSLDMGKNRKSSTNLGRSLIKDRFGSTNRTRNKDPSLVYFICSRINGAFI